MVTRACNLDWEVLGQCGAGSLGKVLHLYVHSLNSEVMGPTVPAWRVLCWCVWIVPAQWWQVEQQKQQVCYKWWQLSISNMKPTLAFIPGPRFICSQRLRARWNPVWGEATCECPVQLECLLQVQSLWVLYEVTGNCWGYESTPDWKSWPCAATSWVLWGEKGRACGLPTLPGLCLLTLVLGFVFNDRQSVKWMPVLF